VRVLAEIPARSSPVLRPGTLRRADLTAYVRLLEELHPARSILVTGEAPGRREAAAGLAVPPAAAGTRTALLECELAEPGLAEALGLAVAPGLHEYLRGTAGSEAILKPVVLAGPGSAGASEPLVCVVAGRPAGDGAALLGSERFRNVVSGLGSSYELLVIDGPPPDREAELLATMAIAEVTLAWSERGMPPPSLPGPAAGLLVQDRDSAQRS
jgi:Mrp family chromosome partitioning ATPase